MAFESQSKRLATKQYRGDMPVMDVAKMPIALPDGVPVTVNGNRLELVVNSAARLNHYLSLIRQARSSVSLITYIFEADAAGHAVLAALVEAAKRGVAVRLIADSFGSGDIDDSFFAPLRDAGGSVQYFSRRWRSSYLIRNHQKMLIIDNGTAFLGGFNLSSEYFDGCATSGWTDLGLILTGPDVAPIVDWFDQLDIFTHQQDGKWLRLRAMMRSWQRDHPPSGTFQWLLGGPTQRLSPWARAIRSDLTIGRRIDMVMAYFSPGQGMLRRFARAARRGPVRLISAARSDNGATIGAARLLYGYMLRKGVAIHEYQAQRLHMKLIVVDDVVYIGSANFDMRSLFVNLEVMLRIESPELATQARALVDAMVEQSEEITRDWMQGQRGWWTRLRWFMSWFVVSTVDYSVARRLNFGLEMDPDPSLPPGPEQR